MGPTLVIVAEVDRICRSGDRDATQIAEIIKAGGGKTQALLFSGEVLLEGAGPDPGGRRIRDFQARAMGLKNYAQVLGSWDLTDFLGKAKIRGLDMVKFGVIDSRPQSPDPHRAMSNSFGKCTFQPLKNKISPGLRGHIPCGQDIVPCSAPPPMLKTLSGCWAS